MNARALAVLLTLLLAPLTGCLANQDTPNDVTTAAEDEGKDRSSPDGRGRLIAFEETNETESGSGGVDHHHDHWAGRGRVTVFETKAMMRPWPGSDGAFAVFRPPTDTFIWEATGSVEFTLSDPERHVCEPFLTFGGYYYCTDYLGDGRPAGPAIPDVTGGPSGLKLQYKHASTVQWIDAGAISWGVPTIIQITHPTQTDMPHATSSVWEFRVVSPNDYDITLKFTAKAEIVRGEGDVPLWPGHPLFYTEAKPHRTVVNELSAKGCDNGLTATGCTLSDGSDIVIPDKLVSYGTRTIFVWLNITSVSMPSVATAPNAWFLYHRNATGQTNITNPFDFANYGIEKRELSWVLPVDDGGMDSPYADGSRWQFELGASYTSPDNPVQRVSCYGGCADWSADYTITVIASSIILEPKDYHMSCLDPKSHCPRPDEGDGRAPIGKMYRRE